MADEIAAVRADVLHWRLLAALTWQVGTTLLAGSLWNAAQLRTWTRSPVATILSLRAALTVCALAALQAAAVLVVRRVRWLPRAQRHRHQTVSEVLCFSMHGTLLCSQRGRASGVAPSLL